MFMIILLIISFVVTLVLTLKSKERFFFFISLFLVFAATSSCCTMLIGGVITLFTEKELIESKISFVEIFDDKCLLIDGGTVYYATEKEPGVIILNEVPAANVEVIYGAETPELTIQSFRYPALFEKWFFPSLKSPHYIFEIPNTGQVNFNLIPVT